MSKGIDEYLYVLLADDDADDRMFFEDAVSELQLKVDLRTVKDGAELVNYLQRSGSIMPQILFLDLNMPFKNGFQCLEEIRSLEKFNNLCIILYSTTARPSDMELGYHKGANVFVQKPSSFTDLKKMLLKIFTMNILDLCPNEGQIEFRI